MKPKQIFIALLSGVFLISCGNEKKDNTDTEQNVLNENIQHEPVKREETVEVVLLSDDRMKFDKSKIEVFEGQQVRLILKHNGSIHKTAMGHNFVLLNSGVDLSEFGRMASEAADDDYIPKDALNIVIAHTKMIGGGESDTIEFMAPAKGIYDYICSFPGHYSMMKGQFIVK